MPKLRSYNYDITVLDKLDYCSSINNLPFEISKKFAFVHGDITDLALVDDILVSRDIDTVIHLAAQTHVDNSFVNALEFTKNNVLGTHVLLEAARKHKLKCFLHVSTDEVLGEIEPNASFDESAPLSPSNPYAASKASAECLVKSYIKSFGIPAIIIRSNNVFGPGQYPEKIIPKFIALLMHNHPCTLHGDGLNSRKYLYCTDAVAAIDVILHNGVVGDTYHIGSDFEITNLALAKKLQRAIGVSSIESEVIHFVHDRAFNDMRYSISSQKLHKHGWKPVVNFDDGLQLTS